jgi:hypothetical protein
MEDDMAFYNLSARTAIADINQGIRVDRAAADLPQTTNYDLFTVAGGNVLLLGILGEVTTVIETQANNTNLEFSPTAATLADSDLCAVLDITADVVGTLYTIDGTAANAMVDSGTDGWVAYTLASPLFLVPGAIELHCAASNDGQVKWTCWYVPLDPGAYIVAA